MVYKNSKNILLIKISAFLLLMLGLTACNKIEKTVNEVKALQQIKITYDDYNVEYDQYKRSVYVDLKREFMTGHYYVMYQDKISEEFIVKGGILDGFHKTYSTEGYLSKELEYTNGYLDGTTKSYDKDGRVVNSATYSKGKRIGDKISYSENGKKLTTTETVNGITYNHNYEGEKLRMTTYSDKIDGVTYEIMLHFDHVESLKAAFAIKDGESNPTDSSKLYILDNQLKITDSISPKNEPEKMMQIMRLLQQ